MQEKRYVIQQHTTADGVHWDLMLERGDVLTTFRLEEMPAPRQNRGIPAEKIFDHPLRFLTYEGPVQQGTGRVRLVDRGTYEMGQCSDETIALNFTGDLLRGDFTLTHTHAALWDLVRAKPPAQD